MSEDVPALPPQPRETRDSLDRVLCCHGRPIYCAECGEDYAAELNKPAVAPALPAVEALQQIIERMRSEKPRYKSHDLGFVDSVSSNLVDTWADELEAVIAAIPSPQTWQPIETAPKDRDVLGWFPYYASADVGGSVFVMRWNEDKYAKKLRPYWEASGWVWGVLDQRKKQPTRWMPLPDPPVVASPRGGPAQFQRKTICPNCGCAEVDEDGYESNGPAGWTSTGDLICGACNHKWTPGGPAKELANDYD